MDHLKASSITSARIVATAITVGVLLASTVSSSTIVARLPESDED